LNNRLRSAENCSLE
jgi:chromosome segregation ATPase